MKPSEDQFHDTLHQTRVRREIAENERQAFAAEHERALDALGARLKVAIAASDAGGYAGEASYLKLRRRCETMAAAAREQLDRIHSAEAERWYERKPAFEDCLAELDDAVELLETLCVD